MTKCASINFVNSLKTDGVLLTAMPRYGYATRFFDTVVFDANL